MQTPQRTIYFTKSMKCHQMGLISPQPTNLTGEAALCIPRYRDSPFKPRWGPRAREPYPQCGPNRRKILQSRHNRERITDPRLRWDARWWCTMHQHQQRTSTMTKSGAPWKSLPGARAPTNSGSLCTFLCNNGSGKRLVVLVSWSQFTGGWGADCAPSN